jgi:CBS domain-containing protein
MGVDVRLHMSFPLLLIIAATYSIATTGQVVRGLGLWLALCFAVVVREAARALAAGYVGLRLRAIFLLPVGGVMAFAPGGAGHGASVPGTRIVSAAGPIANFSVGLLLMGACYALDPHVQLLTQPWIGTSHVLRSTIWIQLLLGAVSLLPTSAMPSRQLLGTRSAPGGKETGNAQIARSILPAFSFGTGVALAMILTGFVLMSLWLVILGGFMLLGAQLSGGQAAAVSSETESILVREVMLTEYTLLSTTDTLRDALSRTVHSLQDVFPIVRGDRLVGSVARQTIADRLIADGDSYLQGVMSRSLQTAAPDEPLVEALRRSASMGASEFIPVIAGDAMVGILTPQNLNRAAQQIQFTRQQPQQQEQR